jgi:hypothetical protein
MSSSVVASTVDATSTPLLLHDCDDNWTESSASTNASDTDANVTPTPLSALSVGLDQIVNTNHRGNYNAQPQYLSAVTAGHFPARGPNVIPQHDAASLTLALTLTLANRWLLLLGQGYTLIHD